MEHHFLNLEEHSVVLVFLGQKVDLLVHERLVEFHKSTRSIPGHFDLGVEDGDQGMNEGPVVDCARGHVGGEMIGNGLGSAR